MRVIIAGSRGIADFRAVGEAVLESGFAVTEVVSGAARGVDRLGERWALRQGLPLRRFPADWEHLGKGAGYRRNEQMAEYADAAVLCWDGQSRGTAHLRDLMRALGKPCYVHRVERESLG